jgi:hypothetical protein
MRRLGIALACLAGLLVLLVALIFGISESGGEIVTLETLDAEGLPHETRLWVADDGGESWLRSGMPTSGWFLRLEANPDVRITRAGETRAYRAEAVRDPAVRDRIHARMAEKYGFAERVIGVSRDGTQSIPVRLVPLTNPE